MFREYMALWSLESLIPELYSGLEVSNVLDADRTHTPTANYLNKLTDSWIFYIDLILARYRESNEALQIPLFKMLIFLIFDSNPVLKPSA